MWRKEIRQNGGMTDVLPLAAIPRLPTTFPLDSDDSEIVE